MITLADRSTTTKSNQQLIIYNMLSIFYPPAQKITLQGYVHVVSKNAFIFIVTVHL